MIIMKMAEDYGTECESTPVYYEETEKESDL